MEGGSNFHRILLEMDPPTIFIKKAKEYKQADYDQPYIIVSNESCETKLSELKEGILGINFQGIMRILEGAVPPTQVWLKHIFNPLEQGIEYTKMYPKQAWILAKINDILLRHKLGINIDYKAIKAELLNQSFVSKDDFSFVSLPAFSIITPSFYSEPFEKYVWVFKLLESKLNMKDKAFETLLGTLEKEESEHAQDARKGITEVYNYSLLDTSSMMPVGSGSSGIAPLLKVEPQQLKLSIQELQPVLQRKLEDTISSLRKMKKSTPQYEQAYKIAQNDIMNLMGGRKIAPVVYEQMQKLINDEKPSYESAMKVILKEIEKVDEREKTIRDVLEKAITEIAKKLQTLRPTGSSKSINAKDALFHEVLSHSMDDLIRRFSSVESQQLRTQIEETLKSLIDRFIPATA